MQKLKVEPIEHLDVHGKTKFYLKISNDVDSYVITVGQRTIDECKRMINMKPQTKLELENTEKPSKDGDKG